MVDRVVENTEASPRATLHCLIAGVDARLRDVLGDERAEEYIGEASYTYFRRR